MIIKNCRDSWDPGNASYIIYKVKIMSDVKWNRHENAIPLKVRPKCTFQPIIYCKAIFVFSSIFHKSLTFD
jgi:hypothetical protein